MPLVLFGAVMSVPLLREPAQMQIGSSSESTSTNSGERQSKNEAPASAALGRKDDQPSGAKGGEQAAKTPKVGDNDGVKWTDEWIARLTVALALLALAQFVAAGLQARWTGKAVGVAQVSADAAHISASSAQRTVAVMEQNSERELRAYVNIGNCCVEGFGGANVTFDIAVRNFGHTPAQETKSWLWACVDTFPPSSRDWFNPPKNFPIASMVIPAGGHVLISKIQLPLTTEQTASIRAGTHAIFAFGTVRYRDVFKQDRRTAYRLFFGGRTGTPDSGVMSYYGEGNESD